MFSWMYRMVSVLSMASSALLGLGSILDYNLWKRGEGSGEEGRDE